MMKKYNFIILASMLFATLAITGCKKYANPPGIYEDLKLVSNVQRKILVISIDGLTGTELKAIAPTNITAMQNTSKYSMGTLRGVSDAGGWVSMMTGTGYAKHNISKDSFEKNQDPNGNPHATVVSYRNVLDYITQYKSVKTAVISPWANLRYYLRGADFAPIAPTDAAVKDSTISLLATQVNLGSVVVNFREVEAAGNAGAFSSADAGYKAAINTTDGYIGEVMKALKARKTYANEDWLVIVTTNHGGSSDNPTNGFIIVYNPLLKPIELKKSGFNSVLFNSLNTFATVPNDNDLYNAGTNQDFTVQAQVKFPPTSSNFPVFLSKRLGSVGWTWFQNSSGGVMSFSVGGAAAGASTLGSFGIVGDNTWHTVTMTVKTINATTRDVTAYVDGVQVLTPLNIQSKGSISTTEPLRVGRQVEATSFGTSLNMANLAYFNTALNPAVILANLSLKDITQHPNYNSLIGYWPMDEGAEPIFYNTAPNGYNMQISGTYAWASLGNLFPPSSTGSPASVGSSIQTTTSDVTALMLYWMKIKILPEFGIDGNPFLNQFEIEFLK